jgi:hypothetical protein
MTQGVGTRGGISGVANPGMTGFSRGNRMADERLQRLPGDCCHPWPFHATGAWRK